MILSFDNRAKYLHTFYIKIRVFYVSSKLDFPNLLNVNGRMDSMLIAISPKSIVRRVTNFNERS